MNRRMMIKRARQPMFKASKKYARMIKEFSTEFCQVANPLRAAMLDIIGSRDCG